MAHAFIIRVIATSTTPAAAALTWNCGSGREIQLNIWIGITVNGDDSQSKLMNGGAPVTIGGGRKAINVNAPMVMIGAASPMARYGPMITPGMMPAAEDANTRN